MSTVIKSKHAIVARPPFELYMAFTDMRNLLNFVPEEKKQGITADYDAINATVQGYDIGVEVVERVPYSKLVLKSNDRTPVKFSISLFFNSIDLPNKTDFSIELSAEMNLMLKMMLGSKLQQGLDKIVTSLAEASEGKLREDIDKSWFEA